MLNRICPPENLGACSTDSVVPSLVCWPPPFPSTTYFGSEKQLPPITGNNSIRQEIVLEAFVSISFWCVDRSSGWTTLMCIFLSSEPSSTCDPVAFKSISLSLRLSFSCRHPSHRMGWWPWVGIRRGLWILANRQETQPFLGGTW